MSDSDSNESSNPYAATDVPDRLVQDTIWWLPLLVGPGFLVVDVVVIVCLMSADPFLIFHIVPFLMLVGGVPAAFVAAAVAIRVRTKRLSVAGVVVLVVVAVAIAALNFAFVAACSASV